MSIEPDDRQGRAPPCRATLMAALEGLERMLSSGHSATRVLETLCRAGGLGPGVRAVTVRPGGPDMPTTPEVRAALQAGEGDAVVHRRVDLRWGDLTLSEADNWYVPARLPDVMNRQLAETDMSFGRVVEPLGFRRTTISSVRLWRPDDDGEGTGGRLCLPAHVLRHSALLFLPDGVPISLVIERYRAALLDLTQTVPGGPAFPSSVHHSTGRRSTP